MIFTEDENVDISRGNLGFGNKIKTTPEKKEILVLDEIVVINETGSSNSNGWELGNNNRATEQ